MFRTDVVGIRKTFLRMKVESPTPDTINCYLKTDIKEYSAEALREKHHGCIARVFLMIVIEIRFQYSE